MISEKIQLEEFIIKNWTQINRFIDREMSQYHIPFYSSVDIRESKDKFAPIDNNLYPAGFNNLCLLDLDKASREIERTIEHYSPTIWNIAIIVESHTKNLFYLDNLFYLRKAIEESGRQVDLISFDDNLFSNNETQTTLTSHSKFELIIKKASIQHHKIATDQQYDLVILNNDQSSPIDIDWGLVETPIHPSPQMGWFNRQKIEHFDFYANAIENFCDKFSINPELLKAKHDSIKNIDFSNKDGLDHLADKVNRFKESINSDQKIFIKASKGTYGMGIQVVDSGDDILSMNRKNRDRMDIGKNKIKFTDILIQEGVDTVLTYDQMPAEVTIYLIGGRSVGGFMRANEQKSNKENLNSKGMVFKKFCISEIRQNRDDVMKEAVYSVVARLSCLAAAMEVSAMETK